MSWKKILALLVVLMAVTLSAEAAVDQSANAKLARIEIDTYGFEQSGALLDRISRLEKDFSGQNMAGNMNARIEAIYDTLYDNAAGPGLLAKINALEWNVNHQVEGGGIDSRITTLETTILGKTTPGTFNARIRALAKNSYGDEILPIAQVQIPANTLIKIETTAPVSSKNMLAGDVIPVRVIEDVFVDGSLIFATGLTGEGTITRVVRATNIFSNGKIETDFHTLKAIDGQSAKTFVGTESIEEMTVKEMARGLSLVGQTFSGKHKDVEEILIRGKNIELPAGIQLYVQIKEPIVVYGVRADGNGLYFDDSIAISQSAVSQPADVQPADNPPVNNQPVVDTPSQQTQPQPKTNPQFGNGGLSDDELTIQAPDEPAASSQPDAPEPRPEENKSPNDDGEIIEIIDEE